MWKCCTDWNAAAPFACIRLRPSGFSAARRAVPTRLAVVMAAARSAGSASKRLAACAFVITRQCPGFSGPMSMIASVRSSSWSFADGICAVADLAEHAVCAHRRNPRLLRPRLPSSSRRSAAARRPPARATNRAGCDDGSRARPSPSGIATRSRRPPSRSATRSASRVSGTDDSRAIWSRCVSSNRARVSGQLSGGAEIEIAAEAIVDDLRHEEPLRAGEVTHDLAHTSTRPDAAGTPRAPASHGRPRRPCDAARPRSTARTPQPR